MTATYMTPSQRADYDDTNGPLLRICTRDGISSTDWQTIALAAHSGDVGHRADALLLLAGPLTDVLEPGDDEVLLRAFLPRLSVADRCTVLASVRGELAQVARWENIAAGDDYPDDSDADPDERAAAFRWSARDVATTAVMR